MEAMPTSNGFHPKWITFYSITSRDHDPPKEYPQTLASMLSNVNPISPHGHERIPRGLANLLAIHKTLYHHLGSHMKHMFHFKDVNPLCRPHNKHGY
jgi:hypothetical protein